MVIRLRLTQEELAKMISCTRESVAQALASLRQRGMLAVVRDRIVLLGHVRFGDDWSRAVIDRPLEEAQNSKVSQPWINSRFIVISFADRLGQDKGVSRGFPKARRK